MNVQLSCLGVCFSENYKNCLKCSTRRVFVKSRLGEGRLGRIEMYL